MAFRQWKRLYIFTAPDGSWTDSTENEKIASAYDSAGWNVRCWVPRANLGAPYPFREVSGDQKFAPIKSEDEAGSLV